MKSVTAARGRGDCRLAHPRRRRPGRRHRLQRSRRRRGAAAAQPAAPCCNCSTPSSRRTRRSASAAASCGAPAMLNRALEQRSAAWRCMTPPSIVISDFDGADDGDAPQPSARWRVTTMWSPLLVHDPLQSDLPASGAHDRHRRRAADRARRRPRQRAAEHRRDASRERLRGVFAWTRGFRRPGPSAQRRRGDRATDPPPARPLAGAQRAEGGRRSRAALAEAQPSPVDPLAGLIDIPLPAPVSLWPQTWPSRHRARAGYRRPRRRPPGGCVRWWWVNRYRRAALAELVAIERTLEQAAAARGRRRRAGAAGAPHGACGLSRASRSRRSPGRLGSAFLDRSYGGDEFRVASGRVARTSRPISRRESGIAGDAADRIGPPLDQDAS